MRELEFLGAIPEPGESKAREKTASLLHEGCALAPGALLPLVRKRSPWRAGRPTERVLVGSHPARADILLEGEGIRPEHVRVYFPREGDGPADLLVIESHTTRVAGQPVEPRDWTALQGDEEIEFGPWRFRYVHSGPSEDVGS